MGLDMHIFKASKEIPSLKNTMNKLREEVSKELNSFNQDDIRNDVKKFRKEHLKYFNTESEKDITDSLYNVIIHFSYEEVDDEYNEKLQWWLFNYLTVFDFSTSDKDKQVITLAFSKLTKKYIVNNITMTKVSEYRRIEEVISTKTTEVCYWRKYHNLNNYILDTFGGDNCEDTPLTKDIVKQMITFVKEDGEDTNQLESLLNDWDDAYNYYYHPWW